MNITKKNKEKDMRNETLNRNILMFISFVFGVLLTYGYFVIDTSEDINYYQDLAASDTSGFRFIIFLGILKYGILLLGLTFIVTTLTIFIRQRINKNAT